MKTNILTLVITLVVGVTLCGALLGPVVSDAQTNIGPEVTLENDTRVVMREIQDGDILKLNITIDGETKTNAWYLNDELISLPGGETVNFDTGLISDACYVQINRADYSACYCYDMTLSTPNQILVGASDAGTYEITWTASNGEIIFDTPAGTWNPNADFTKSYTWGYVICPLEEGEYTAAVSGGTAIVDSPADLILCGAYTTGEFDTMYAYHNGQVYSSNTDYTLTVPYELATHQGTTDIYDITVSVDVTDGVDTENFTPYRLYVPYEVTGHAASGSMYNLLGIIPIMVIVALLMVAVGAIAYRRAD